jgi:gliding motility-associated-like protein
MSKNNWKHSAQKVFIALMAIQSLATIAQVDFEVPDTVCISDSMQPVNLSRQAESYYWNFCSGNLLYQPEGIKIDKIGGVDAPAFIEIVHDGDEFYAFVTNHLDGTISRLSFGNNLLNAPVSVNLGNPGGALPTHLQGIQIKKEGNNWYGFVVGGLGNASRIVRLEFGNSLLNNPTALNLGNIGNLDYPIDLFLFQDKSNWYAYTVNYTSGTISRLFFGENLGNIPTGENLGNIGNLNEPCGIFPIIENGSWYIFITNFGSNTISKLDFGGSIISMPTGSNIGGNSYLYSPFDLTMIKDCERTFGFVVNHYSNELTRMIFEGGVENDPVFEPLGNVGGMYQPHGLSKVFREGNDLFLFAANLGDNTLTRFFFPSCNNASPANSKVRDPAKVTYNQPGEYNVVLILDEGLATSEIMCKNVIAVNNPNVFLGNDTSIFPGTSLTLTPDKSFEAYQWSTGENSQSIMVDKAGNYVVEVTDQNGCKNSDQINISMQFFIPDFFSPNGDLINDVWALDIFRNEPGVHIKIYDRYGKLISDQGQDWDGTYRGKNLPSDTYWYIITFDNGSKPLKGNVTIIR